MYYDAVDAQSSEETGILNTEIAPLCAPLEIELERYVSAG